MIQSTLSKEEERRLKKEIRDQLWVLIRRGVPIRAWQEWSYDQAVAFKQAVYDAEKACNRENSTVTHLQLALSTLRGFYEGHENTAPHDRNRTGETA